LNITESKTRTAAAIALALLACLLAAGRAGAVVVKLHSGHFAGVTPRAGVSPAAIRGVVRRSQAVPQVDNGSLSYGGGPVMRSSSPYLVYWVPSGESIPASTQALMTKYFTDVAHDSGGSTNVYGVLRQYTDNAGFADYKQTFSNAQVIVDTQPYPATDSSSCSDSVPADEAFCVTDAQLQAELTRLIAAKGLPTDGAASASELVANAPLYFIVTPANVNVCTDFSDCADNVFCAYHSNYVSGSNNVLYSAIPLLPALVTDKPALDPKYCQQDNNTAVQEPNGDGGDVALKYMSHEDSEAITDPIPNSGWTDPTSGNEVGDNCNGYNGGASDPTKGNDVNAFEPPLGGSAGVAPGTGTLYDQLINGDQYYLQSEWSNAGVNCDMQPGAGTLTPSFTAPSGTSPVGTSVNFDGSASTTTAGWSSVTWSFGDGTSAFSKGSAPGPVSHKYAAVGTFTVTLTTVDTFGNLATASHLVTITGVAPTAAFTVPAAPGVAGSPVSFNATGSSDSNAGGSIASYSWSFGDGVSGSGAKPSHTYASGGMYTVSLTVTDNYTLSSTTVTKTIQVFSLLTPGTVTLAPATPVAGAPVSFTTDGWADPNSGGSISTYGWSFGDGFIAAGATASHTYASAGAYTVTLTVTDSLGVTTTKTLLITVVAPGKPTASQASVAGLASGSAKLSFVLAAGTNAPGLERIMVRLPAGMSFVKHGLAKGVVVESGGVKLAFTAKLANGVLVITLPSPASQVQITIGHKAISVGGPLRAKVKHHQLHTLSVPVTAVDSAGHQTKLTVKFKL
jgi:PKD repeat protein